jgi:predicted Zn-dependent peptidase
MFQKELMHAPPADASHPASAYAFRLSTLPNGLRVATAEMPHMASACVGLWAAVGSRNESARLNGAAHFLEHLLFKGTRRRSARRISGEVEALGGYLDAFTAEDHTCYFAKAEARRVASLGDVLSDLFQNSILPEREVERERNVIREEILMYRDQPAQVAEELLAAAMWPGHALGRPLAGTERSVAALRRSDLMAFWRAGYHARSCVLAVAGAVTHEEVIEKVAPALAEMPSGRLPRFTRWTRRTRAAHSAPRAVIEKRECEQVQLALGFTGPGRHDPRRFAARTLSALLGEKMNSRLFQSLRERRGLCYSVQSEPVTFLDTGMIGITAGLDTENLAKALGLIRREIDRLGEELVGARELRETRDYLVGQHRLGLESTTSQMMWLGESVLAHGRIINPDEVTRQLAAVTAEEVRDAARVCLREGFRALVAVGPVEATGDELLRAFGQKG